MRGIYGADAFTLPLAWLTALATSELRLGIYAMRDLYGIVRFGHLVAMATFVGMVVILDLRGLGLFPPASLDPVRKRLLTVLRTAFATTIATGIVLFLRDPVGVGLHSMFLPKLVLVAIGYAHATVIRRVGSVRRSEKLQQAASMLSLAIWLLVIGASTWNHVERPIRVGDALRLGNTGK